MTVIRHFTLRFSRVSLIRRGFDKEILKQLKMFCFEVNRKFRGIDEIIVGNWRSRE
jgi:hypothetical protein